MGLSSNNPVVLTVVTAGQSFSRTFSVKITQIECNSLAKGIQIALFYCVLTFKLFDIFCFCSRGRMFAIFHGCCRQSRVLQLQQRGRAAVVRHWLQHLRQDGAQLLWYPVRRVCRQYVTRDSDISDTTSRVPGAKVILHLWYQWQHRQPGGDTVHHRLDHNTMCHQHQWSICTKWYSCCLCWQVSGICCQIIKIKKSLFGLFILIDKS